MQYNILRHSIIVFWMARNTFRIDPIYFIALAESREGSSLVSDVQGNKTVPRCRSIVHLGACA
jgi:hypothetical protein